MDKKRTIRYLQRYYENFPEKELQNHVSVIMKRLRSAGKWEEEILSDIIDTLLKENWSLPKIASHLDFLDVEDRT